MKQMFIRALWGKIGYGSTAKNKWEATNRDWRTRLIKDIEVSVNQKIKFPFVCYTFGEDNHKLLLDKGVNSILVDKRDYVWNVDTENFRHKLEVLRLAMRDYDEIAFVDWDTLPSKEIPADFWYILRNKGSFQAALRYDKNDKTYWRDNDFARKLLSCPPDERSIIPSGAFIYIVDKNIAENLCKTWETGEDKNFFKWSEEAVMAKYIDDTEGKILSKDEYWNKYEPEVFILPRRSAMREYANKKNVVFADHFSRSINTMYQEIIKNKPA